MIETETLAEWATVKKYSYSEAKKTDERVLNAGNSHIQGTSLRGDWARKEEVGPIGDKVE